MGWKVEVFGGRERSDHPLRHKQFKFWVIEWDEATRGNDADGFARELKLRITIATWIEIGEFDGGRFALWTRNPAHQGWPCELAVGFIGGHATGWMVKHAFYVGQIPGDPSVFAEILGA